MYCLLSRSYLKVKANGQVNVNWGKSLKWPKHFNTQEHFTKFDSFHISTNFLIIPSYNHSTFYCQIFLSTMIWNSARSIGRKTALKGEF